MTVSDNRKTDFQNSPGMRDEVVKGSAVKAELELNRAARANK